MNDRDYLLKLKILNNRIVELMRGKKIESVAELSRQTKICQSVLHKLINIKGSPLYKKRRECWNSSVLKLGDFFGVLPEEMFNEQQLNEPFLTNEGERAIDIRATTNILNHQEQQYLPDLIMEKEEEVKALHDMLDTITPKEKKIIEMRFGLNDGAHTLKEVGQKFGVSSERARQQELKALRKLRTLYRNRNLPQSKEMNNET